MAPKENKGVKMVTLADVDAEKLSRILNSETIALVPSNSEAPVYIHEELLGSVSPALRAASGGGWSESESKIYKFLKDDDGFFTDVTKELLICFVRWAYIGNYTTELVGVPSFINDPIEEDPIVVADTDTWGFGTSKMKDKKSKKKVYPTFDFDDSPPPPIAIIEEPILEEPILEEPQPSTSFTIPAPAPLTLHINIYVFATVYLIPTLQHLARQKIIGHLSRVESSTLTAKVAYHRAPIFDLLEHASVYLPDDDLLLIWLAKYAGWRIELLRSDAERFEKLLDGGKFAILIVRHLAPNKEDPFRFVF